MAADAAASADAAACGQIPTLRAHFTPTADEFVLFARHGRALARRMRDLTKLPEHTGLMIVLGRMLPHCAIVMFASSLYLMVTRNFMWLGAAIISGALLWAFAMAFLGWGATRKARQQFAKDPRLGYPTTVDADERGFRYFSDRVRYDLNWPAIAGVYQADGVLFIFDTERLTYIVPRRAFAAPNEADQLVKWIEQRAGR
jgi:hypothetical protein